MPDHNRSTRKAQARSLALAAQWGNGWTQADVERVGASDESAEALAATLGRTVYAVQSIRQALAEGRPVGSVRRKTQAQRLAQPWAADDPRWG